MNTKTNLILFVIVTVLMAGCGEQETDCKDSAAQCQHEAMIEHSTGKTNNPKKW